MRTLVWRSQSSKDRYCCSKIALVPNVCQSMRPKLCVGSVVSEQALTPVLAQICTKRAINSYISSTNLQRQGRSNPLRSWNERQFELHCVCLKDVRSQIVSYRQLLRARVFIKPGLRSYLPLYTFCARCRPNQISFDWSWKPVKTSFILLSKCRTDKY